jgi:hypothetical protein
MNNTAKPANGSSVKPVTVPPAEKVVRVRKTYEFLTIVTAMKTRSYVTVQHWPSGKDMTGLVVGIECESGTGRSWNLTLNVNGLGHVTFNIQTN